MFAANTEYTTTFFDFPFFVSSDDLSPDDFVWFEISTEVPQWFMFSPFAPSPDYWLTPDIFESILSDEIVRVVVAFNLCIWMQMVLYDQR